MSDTHTPATVDSEGELDLVALAPQHLAATQEQLTVWTRAKQRALAQELADLEEHLLIATNNGWKLRGLQASMTRTQRRIDYYAKIEAAVADGYLLVPNFPISVLAVRVQRTKPRFQQRSSEWGFHAAAELLPAGQGRYVDDGLIYEDRSVTDPNGKVHPHFVASDFDNPDFPYQLVKPAVLEATDRAMAKRIFDVIGMVENQAGRDPIMVGQLLDPRGNSRRCTFFIAWWLNTRSL